MRSLDHYYVVLRAALNTQHTDMPFRRFALMNNRRFSCVCCVIDKWKCAVISAKAV